MQTRCDVCVYVIHLAKYEWKEPEATNSHQMFCENWQNISLIKNDFK